MKTAKVLVVAAISLGFSSGCQSSAQSETVIDKGKGDFHETTSTELATMTDFSKFMTFYYKNPQPELVPASIQFAQKEGLFENPQAVNVLLATYSKIFATNPQIVETCVEPIAKMNPRNKLIMLSALLLANTRESRDAAMKLSAQLPEKLRPDMKRPPTPIEDMTPTPAILDMLWASFFITGNPKYVEKIISVIPGTDGEKEVGVITASVARWSLTSNVQQHERVKEICESAKDEHPEWKHALEGVLKDADEKSG